MKILKEVSSEWETTKNDNEVPCHSRMVEGVLCRWWGDGPAPRGVAILDSRVDHDALREELAQVKTERDEANKEREWVRKKIKIASSAPITDVYGALHILEANSHGYLTYIKSFRCNDKQGEIARLTVERDALREELQTLKKTIRKDIPPC